MDPQEYLSVLRRRWRVVIFLTVATFAVAAFFSLRGGRAYEATTRVAVSIGGYPAGDPLPYGYTRERESWLAAEYLADDLSEIIKSDAFLEDVRKQLDPALGTGLVREVVRAKKTHRILEVTIQAGTPEAAEKMAGAVNEVIRKEGPKYLAQLQTSEGKAVPIDVPRAHPATTTGSLAGDLGLRAGLGLVVGIFFAFVLDYLDTRLTSTGEVERVLGLSVLAAIPADHR